MLNYVFQAFLFALYIPGAESWTDREIVDYSHDNTNESYQSEWWEYDKPAVLPFDEVFTNSSKYILYFVDKPSNLLKKLLF